MMNSSYLYYVDMISIGRKKEHNLRKGILWSCADGKDDIGVRTRPDKVSPLTSAQDQGMCPFCRPHNTRGQLFAVHTRLEDVSSLPSTQEQWTCPLPSA